MVNFSEQHSFYNTIRKTLRPALIEYTDNGDIRIYH